MRLLAIDPGKHHAGWALFVDGKLTRAGIEKAPEVEPVERADYRQGRHKAHVTTRCALVGNLIHGVGFVDEVIAELPHVYVDGNRRLTGKADPNDLLFLAFTAGVLTGSAHRADSRLVEPSEWKGQRPDSVTWKWIRDAMKPAEIEIAIAHDVYDDRHRKTFHHGLEAIGIGLWASWRL